MHLYAVLAALLLLIALYHASIYIQRRGDRFNLYFAILALAFAVYLTDYFVTALPRFAGLELSYLAFQKIVFAAMHIAAFAAGLFVAELLNRRPPKWFTLAYALLLAAAVASLVIAPDFRVFTFLRAGVQYTLLVPVAYILFLLVTGLIRRQKWAPAVLIGVSPQILAVLYDLIARETLKTPGITLTAFGVAASVVVLFFILSIRSVRDANEAERLNRELEAAVEARTSELRSTSSRLEEALSTLEDTKGKLEGLAVTDSLTGVFNRRAFDLRLDEEVRRARRNRSQMSLLMIDIDRFKTINDDLGHLCGDQCLGAVASTIRKSLKRPADFLARYGGEELVALLPETSLPGAEILAERIRKEIEELEIPYEGRSVRLTVSIGVCSRMLDAEILKDAMLSSAESALHQAKSQGRNRVVLSD